MKKAVLLIFIGALSAASERFAVSGWEYSRTLLQTGTQTRQLSCAVTSADILLFYIQSGSLHAAAFKQNRITAGPVIISKINDRSSYSLRSAFGKAYVMIHNSGQMKIFSITSGLVSKEELSLPENRSYLNDFFPMKDSLILALAEFNSGKYAVKLLRISPGQTNTSRLPEAKQLQKGVFFPEIMHNGTEWKSVFIIREYNEAESVLNDSIYTASASSFEGLSSAVSSKLSTAGYINFPPSYFDNGGDLLLLYPTREKALLHIGVYSTASQKEAKALSGRANASKLRFFRNENILEIFYAAGLAQQAWLGRTTFNLKSFAPASEEEICTSKESLIQEFDTAQSDGKFLFHLNSKADEIWFSSEDKTAPAVKASVTLRQSKQLSKSWAFVSWDEIDDSSGAAGYAASVDQSPATDPGSEANLLPGERWVDTSLYPKGIWYLHLRAFDRLGNKSPAVHVRVRVGDWTAPAVSKKKNIPPPEEEERYAEDTRLAWAQFQKYINAAQKALNRNDVWGARKQIVLASLIQPGSMETLVLTEAVHAQQKNPLKTTLPWVLLGLFALAALAMVIKQLKDFSK